ncbi:MAG TPA: hypothetical protein VF571_18635, partial [Pyrinomonadaceae bacterium]
MKINLLMVFAVISLCFFKTEAQQPQTAPTGDLILEKGVPPHKGLDEVYRRFSEGYRKLDAVSVTELYTETAAYLAPGSNVQIGRQDVLKNFSSFFDSVKRQNGKIEIIFRIVQREVDRNMAYDVGIYTLVSTNSKGESRRSSGKFVVVAKREKNDVWRFQVDGYSDLPNVNSNNQRPQSSGTVSQAEHQTIRRALEVQYAKLAEALKNKDFEAFQALRTSDFSTIALNGGQQTTEQMEARTRLLLSVIQPPMEVGFEILNLNPRNAETAVATIRQRFSRMQEIAGKLRPIQTAVTQDETWVKTPDGWKLKFVENEKDLLRFIDGKRVEPGKPYDPNAPPYDPPTETSLSQKDLETLFDPIFAERMHKLNVPGAVISVVKDGKTVFTKGYGAYLFQDTYMV